MTSIVRTNASTTSQSAFFQPRGCSLVSKAVKRTHLVQVISCSRAASPYCLEDALNLISIRCVIFALHRTSHLSK
uniref:Uncharacterized protein n=1 Tax=Parascaris univalens TaxID=6257 RepID=A0A915ANB5_PARUN